MSNRQNTPTNTNNERTGYANGYKRALDESFCPQASTFLRSRKQSISIDWDMGADHGGTPARVKGPQTYTRKAFADAVRALLPSVLEHGTMSGYAGTDPADIGERAIAGILSTENARSKYGTFAMCVGQIRNNAKKDADTKATAKTLKANRKAGNVFLCSAGKEHVSMKKAINATCRHSFKSEWDEANAKDDKAMRADIKNRASALLSGNDAPAPVAKQSSASASVNAQQAKNMAKAMGATGADIKSKASAIAFLEARGISL